MARAFIAWTRRSDLRTALVVLAGAVLVCAVLGTAIGSSSGSGQADQLSGSVETSMTEDQQQSLVAQNAWADKADGTDCDTVDDKHLRCTVYETSTMNGVSDQEGWAYNVELYVNDKGESCYDPEPVEDMIQPLDGACFYD